MGYPSSQISDDLTSFNSNGVLNNPNVISQAKIVRPTLLNCRPALQNGILLNVL